jgi:SAM-dependent methyltransferase
LSAFWLSSGYARRRSGSRVEQDERLLHASSFGAAATAYAEHRPDYAQAAVRWALEPAPGTRVLDLGAGTGKLTATLAALGAEVIAVEPDPAMLTELSRALPTVRALPGSAEAIPLPDGSVDAVLAGNAMHWFDMAVAGPEIARVLAPGGILAGLWNVMDDQVEWVAGLARVSGSAAIGPRDTPTSWRRSRPSSRTGSAAPPTPSSRPSRRARGCWSCRNRNVRPRSAGSVHSLPADRRPPTASSPSRC